jgi:hypothetical protein
MIPSKMFTKRRAQKQMFKFGFGHIFQLSLNVLHLKLFFNSFNVLLEYYVQNFLPVTKLIFKFQLLLQSSKACAKFCKCNNLEKKLLDFVKQ